MKFVRKNKLLQEKDQIIAISKKIRKIARNCSFAKWAENGQSADLFNFQHKKKHFKIFQNNSQKFTRFIDRKSPKFPTKATDPSRIWLANIQQMFSNFGNCVKFLQ